MKIFRILTAVLLSVCLYGCSNNDDGSRVDYTDGPVNQWVYETLSSVYLWNDEVQAKSPDYSINYARFFRSLLSNKDGKHDPQRRVDYYYSYIERVSKVTDTRFGENDLFESSFGFDFILTRSHLINHVLSPTQTYEKLYATVVYVIPDSPADKKGLKRGDYIYKIGTDEIPLSGYNPLISKLMSGPDISQINITKCELEQVGINPADGLPIVERSNEDGVTLTPELVSTNPIFLNEVYETGMGQRVGYLVYNMFDRGGSNNPVYDNDLKTVMKEFSAAGVSDLILDLRYNPGGYVSSCQLLSSMIAPAGVLGTTFQIMRTNSKSEPLPFLRVNEMESDLYGTEPGANLNLSRVYVIATHSSASASEALMHCLRGANVEVYHIGNPTEGKNVGMSGYSSEGVKGLDYETFMFEMYPVTFYVHNAKDETYSTDGINPFDAPTPGYLYYEDFDLEWLELGDPEEPMLKAALTHIETGAFPSSTRSAVRSNYNQLKMPVSRRSMYLRD